MEHSDAIEDRIRAKTAEFERFYDKITSCRVTVEAPHHHHNKGNLYSVRVEIHLPDKQIVVGKERRHHHAHEDVYVAIRDTFKAAVRQLEDYVRIRRGKIKPHEAPDHGKVTRLFHEDGYGFVQMANGSNVYFHENSVASAVFSALKVGDEVRIVVAEGEGEKGPQASTVIPIGKHHIVE
jgi:cold shock CspA family protein